MTAPLTQAAIDADPEFAALDAELVGRGYWYVVTGTDAEGYEASIGPRTVEGVDDVTVARGATKVEALRAAMKQETVNRAADRVAR